MKEKDNIRISYSLGFLFGTLASSFFVMSLYYLNMDMKLLYLIIPLALLLLLTEYLKIKKWK